MPERLVALDALEVPLSALGSDLRQAVDHRLGAWIARACRISPEDVLGYDIQRRSLDARRKPDLRLVYHLVARVREDAAVAEGEHVEVLLEPPAHDEGLGQLALKRPLPMHPLVVGAGPAGQMAAYLLALHGCQPLIIDRGRDADRRSGDLARFHQSRALDPESNYLFGEGGAGTYSDGKLYTRVKDRRMRFLLEAFVAARAPRMILWRHHPHIGSDLLPHMCKRLRSRIEAWGGRFRWGAQVADLIIEPDAAGRSRCGGVVLADGERIQAPLTLIAPGHSARDLIHTLIGHGLAHRAKGFQLGCRVEHAQSLIDHGQYGCAPPKPLIGAAEYNLVSRPPLGRGSESVTTFCMCPGGEIIAATSDPGQLSTNGMSRHARASPFANAGLIVNQPVERDGNAMAGFDLIERLERAAFAAGGSDYTCPAQSCRAFVRGEDGRMPASTSYKLGMRPGRIDRILPEATVRAIREALLHFERVIPGFLDQGALLGVETRVSSPVRFDRDPATLASSLPGLYLAGEGAGYAGGIVSAGLDGLRLAETILSGSPALRER